MNFIFLWIYFTVLSILSIIVYGLYVLLLRYGKFINRNATAKTAVAAILLATAITLWWYAISTTLTLYNKYIFTFWYNGIFHYPLLLTSVHLFVKVLVTRIWACLSSETTPTDTRETFIHVIYPIGILTAMDISLSNSSLIYIPVSLYTTLKVCRYYVNITLLFTLIIINLSYISYISLHLYLCY